MVNEVIRDQMHPSRIYAEAFQVVEYCIQRHDVQLLVETFDVVGLVNAKGEPYTADDALRGGVSGFKIAFALRLNAMCGRGRKGKVWAERYERRDCRTPETTRAALETMFHSAQERREHAVLENGVDLFSTAILFTNFEEDPAIPFVQDEDDDELEDWPVTPAETELAHRTWRLAGPLYASHALHVAAATAAGTTAPGVTTDGSSPRATKILERRWPFLGEWHWRNWRDAVGPRWRPTSRPRAKFFLARGV